MCQTDLRVARRRRSYEKQKLPTETRTAPGIYRNGRPSDACENSVCSPVGSGHLRQNYPPRLIQPTRTAITRQIVVHPLTTMIFSVPNCETPRLSALGSLTSLTYRQVRQCSIKGLNTAAPPPDSLRLSIFLISSHECPNDPHRTLIDGWGLDHAEKA